MLGNLFIKTDVWLGMKYDFNMQQYKWMNKNPVDYTHWFNKQPDPRKGGYVKLSIHDSAKDLLFWQGAKSDEELPFICRTLKGIF